MYIEIYPQTNHTSLSKWLPSLSKCWLDIKYFLKNYKKAPMLNILEPNLTILGFWTLLVSQKEINKCYEIQVVKKFLDNILRIRWYCSIFLQFQTKTTFYDTLPIRSPLMGQANIRV